MNTLNQTRVVSVTCSESVVTVIAHLFQSGWEVKRGLLTSAGLDVILFLFCYCAQQNTEHSGSPLITWAWVEERTAHISSLRAWITAGNKGHDTFKHDGLSASSQWQMEPKMTNHSKESCIKKLQNKTVLEDKIKCVVEVHLFTFIFFVIFVY